jgi:N-acetylneuraminic acid mutarotase
MKTPAPVRRIVRSLFAIGLLTTLHVRAAETWVPTGSLAIGRENSTSTLLHNGKILAVCGSGGSSIQGVVPLSSAELYDPATGVWIQTGALSVARYAHTTTLLSDGRVLVVGGAVNDAGTSTRSAEIYNPISGTWTVTGSLGVARHVHAATLLPDGKVLVTGGLEGSTVLSSAEIYDPTTGVWTDAGTLSVARYGHTATLLPTGKVLAVGSNQHPTVVELFDPSTNGWSIAEPLVNGRWFHTACLLQSGKVLVAGGDFPHRNTSEIYDPVTGGWAVVGNMVSPRSDSFTATLLTNGKVLVAGGWGSFDIERKAEIYNPETATWSATSLMEANHRLHTATLMLNGRVLIAGGAGPSAVAEIFDPGTFVVILSSPANGEIVGIENHYQPDATASLTATPSPGYLFGEWTGDAAGTANPLSLLMDADKTIGASFIPDANDDDGDGWSNHEEIVIHGTNPAIPDTDGDGVDDPDDAFPLDIAESLDTDRDGIGDNADTDDDGDGISDQDEINIHGTNPKRADSDGDGLSDYAEIFTHLTNPLVADTDQDGLSDGAEIKSHGSDPLNPDTDGDGFLDGYEVFTGKSPIDPLDMPALVAEARAAIEFTFAAAIGKAYRIESSTDLLGWQIVESGIVGQGGQVQRFYSTRGMPMRYFRVEED